MTRVYPREPDVTVTGLAAAGSSSGGSSSANTMGSRMMSAACSGGAGGAGEGARRRGGRSASGVAPEPRDTTRVSGHTADPRRPDDSPTGSVGLSDLESCH